MLMCVIPAHLCLRNLPLPECILIYSQQRTPTDNVLWFHCSPESPGFNQFSEQPNASTRSILLWPEMPGIIMNGKHKRPVCLLNLKVSFQIKIFFEWKEKDLDLGIQSLHRDRAGMEFENTTLKDTFTWVRLQGQPFASQSSVWRQSLSFFIGC